MAKRTVERLLALALAGSMTMSVLATAAMAVDYDIANGTVTVESGDSGVQSWQVEGEISSDTTINITNKENITTDQQVVNVGEGVGADVTINIDNVSADVTDTSAIKANGGTVNITDSSLSGGTEEEAAVEVGGNANVNISGETEIIGSGTGLEVSGEGSVTIESGAEVEIVGNGTTVTGGETDISGTGLEVSGGTVTVEEGAEVEITGSDVTLKGTAEANTVSGDSVGMEITGGTVNVEGSVDSQGLNVTAPYANKTDFTVDTSGSVGIAVSGGSLNVAQGGQVAAVDHNKIVNNSGSVKVTTYVEDPKGTYICYKGVYKSKPSTVNHEGEKCYKVMVSGGACPVWDYVPVAGTPLYKQKTNYVNPTMTVDGAGTGLDLSGSAQVKADGSLLATGSGSGVAMADSVKVSVGPDGRLITNYISKNGGSIDNEGLIFVKDAAEGLREAIDNSGTGLRFVSFEQVPKTGVGENYENILHLYWEAGKNESAQELLVPLKDMVVAAWNALYCVEKKQFAGTVVQPGDHMNFDIQITNKSGYTYSYKADSLVVGVGEDALQAFENAANDAIESGNVKFLCSRVPNRAIQDLYGKSHSSEVTLTDLLNVENKLKTDGFDGQTFDSLEAYYLYYINKQAAAQTPAGETPKQYEKLEEVPFNLFENILPITDNTSFDNGLFQLSSAELSQLLDDIDAGKYPDGKYKVIYALDWSTYKYKIQIKETDCVKMQAVYQYMYSLAYGFGEVVDQDIANLKTPPYSTYLDNPLNYIDKDVWQKANDYFDGLTGKGLATGDHTNAQIYVLIDGVLTSNFLQNTAFSLENYIILTRPAEPEKPPVTPEEPGTPPPGGPGTPDNQLRGGYGSFALADNNVNEIIIEDEDVPLADVPKTGDLSMLWLALSGLCGAAVLLDMKRRRTTQV